MIYPVILTAALAALFASTVHASGTAHTGGKTLSRLLGTYASTAPEDWGHGAYGVREFTFDHGRWTLHFVLALDPAMTKPVFEFRTKGRYVVARPSAKVAGAYEADFREDAKYVTLRADDPKLVQAFGLAGCGLTPGIETDVSIKGCAGWRPVTVCPNDHDLLMLDTQGGLHFGVRPADNDMCTPDKRPTALLPAVVKR